MSLVPELVESDLVAKLRVVTACDDWCETNLRQLAEFLRAEASLRDLPVEAMAQIAQRGLFGVHEVLAAKKLGRFRFARGDWATLISSAGFEELLDTEWVDCGNDVSELVYVLDVGKLFQLPEQPRKYIAGKCGVVWELTWGRGGRKDTELGPTIQLGFEFRTVAECIGYLHKLFRGHLSKKYYDNLSRQTKRANRDPVDWNSDGGATASERLADGSRWNAPVERLQGIYCLRDIMRFMSNKNDDDLGVALLLMRLAREDPLRICDFGEALHATAPALAQGGADSRDEADDDQDDADDDQDEADDDQDDADDDQDEADDDQDDSPDEANDDIKDRDNDLSSAELEALALRHIPGYKEELAKARKDGDRNLEADARKRAHGTIRNKDSVLRKDLQDYLLLTSHPIAEITNIASRLLPVAGKLSRQRRRAAESNKKITKKSLRTLRELRWIVARFLFLCNQRPGCLESFRLSNVAGLGSGSVVRQVVPISEHNLPAKGRKLSDDLWNSLDPKAQDCINEIVKRIGRPEGQTLPRGPYDHELGELWGAALMKVRQLADCGERWRKMSTIRQRFPR
jgi:hypothetical protein